MHLVSACFVFVVSFFVLTNNITAQTTTNSSGSTPTENAATTTTNQDAFRFVVYYTGELKASLQDSDSYLRSFLASYELDLINTFEIDEFNKGFTVECKNVDEDPQEIARQLSMLEAVLMVEIIRTPRKVKML